MKASTSAFHLSKWRSKRDEERRQRARACVRALHVVAKDVAAATCHPSLLHEISVHSRIFVESRAAREKDDRGQKSAGRPAEQDECESNYDRAGWLLASAFKD